MVVMVVIDVIDGIYGFKVRSVHSRRSDDKTEI
jgi:hypothetical protein